jgi:hypothetical protein
MLEEPGTNRQSETDAKQTFNKVCDLKQSKRILITNINGLLGYSLFQSLRNDYKLMQDSANGQQPHRFLGTVNPTPAAGIINPSPSDQVKVLDGSAKPKTFVKQVRAADYIIMDIS